MNFFHLLIQYDATPFVLSWIWWVLCGLFLFLFGGGSLFALLDVVTPFPNSSSDITLRSDVEFVLIHNCCFVWGVEFPVKNHFYLLLMTLLYGFPTLRVAIEKTNCILIPNLLYVMGLFFFLEILIVSLLVFWNINMILLTVGIFCVYSFYCQWAI